MKLDRRQTLASWVAGIFAAGSPGTGHGEGMEQLVNKTIPMPATWSGQEKQMIANKMLEQAASIKRDISKLEKFLAGELDEFQQGRMARQFDATYEDIDSLKSVTKATKERMFLKHKKKKEHQSWIDNALKRLRYLKSDTNTLQDKYYGGIEAESENSVESAGRNFR